MCLPAARQLFGAAALGEVNLGMIRLARQHGLPAKFTGSGGAIVVLCETDEALEALQGATPTSTAQPQPPPPPPLAYFGCQASTAEVLKSRNLSSLNTPSFPPF